MLVPDRTHGWTDGNTHRRKYEQPEVTQRKRDGQTHTQTYAHYNIDKTILGVRNDEGDEWIASFNLVSKKPPRSTPSAKEFY